MTWFQRYRLRHYVQNSIWMFSVIFPEPEDRALAGIGDFQGVGGKQGPSEVNRQFEESARQWP